MTFHGAIVEDDDSIRSYLQKSLTEALAGCGCDMEFDCYSSGQQFLNVYQEHYHYAAIFLDIEMPGIDGIEVCRQIRQISPEALVIFISGHSSLVFQTFEVQPFRFVRKSHYQQLLPDLAGAVAQQLRGRQHKNLVISEASSGDLYSFHLPDLLYIEAQRKDCLFVTTTGSTAIRCLLKTAEQQLEGQSFLKPHRSYLVNCAHIFHISKTGILLLNRQEIPISRGRADEIRQQFLSYTMR